MVAAGRRNRSPPIRPIHYDSAMAMHPQKITRRTLFALLMAASAICLILPASWTAPLKHLAQLLVPAEHLFYSGSLRAAQSIMRLDANHDGSQESLDSLRAQLASTAAELQQTLTENDRLRALRSDHIPPAMPVLPAKVVARDIAAARDSLVIARGSQRGVRSGDWLTARLFIDQGQTAGVVEGQAVLTEHCLLGRIELASPFMARVQLFSDVDSPRIAVQVGQMEKRKLRFVEYACSLRGAGKRGMMIEGVDYRYVATDRQDGRRDTKLFEVGDLVFSAAGQLGLPSPMLIGKVARLIEDPKKRLVYNVEVEPLVSCEDLREVFVIPVVPTKPSGD
jgi:cell shape-determining protein MreC